MATARAYVATDMSEDGKPYIGQIESYDESRIVISDGAHTSIYEGKFSYSYRGEVFGTLRALTNKLGDEITAEVAGINRDMHHFNELLLQGGLAAEAYVLSWGDRIYGSNQRDVLLGFTGPDMIDGGGGNDEILGGYGNDALFGRTGNDNLDGGQGRDVLDGGVGNDLLQGGWGEDDLIGGWGRDILIGGGLADKLTGGGGGDTFRFNSVAEAGLGDRADTIMDFQHSDRIDLSGIDADTHTAGDQAFAYVWGREFSGAAGELRFADGLLSGDVNGDGAADFSIEVIGDGQLFKFDLLL